MNRNITAVILIVLAAGIYFTYTKGEIDAARAVQADNDQYISALDNAAKLIRVRDSVKNDYNNLTQDDRDKIAKMIPSTVDNIRLVIELNSIALQHGFSLKGVSASVADDTSKNSQSPSVMVPGQTVSSITRGGITIPTLDTVTVSFGVSASYDGFISFLRDLESNLRIMDITHLTVSANDSGTYDYSVQLKTYWLRQ
jgi:Tfp pilus assembly protein PilO